MTGQTAVRVVPVPDSLRGTPQQVETMIRALQAERWAQGVVPMLDLSAVTFVHPYGAIQLLRACEMISAATKQTVELQSIRPQVHAYLRRVDFFTSSPQTVVSRHPFDPRDDLLRSPASTNLLELHPIESDDDISAAILRAERILEDWLSHSLKERGIVINLISEACRNIVEHSQGRGWMLAQKYERQPTAVELAIADGGIGIEGSLQRAYGPLGSRDSDYIVEAVHGKSSLRPQKKSVGLPTMRSMTETSGGYLFIRSGRGHVTAQRSRLDRRDGLPIVPGTQIAMCFQSSH